MKTIEVNITGNSLLAYVTLFDEDILGQLNEMEEGDFDYHNFTSKHEKKCVRPGRGFCQDGDVNLIVTLDGKTLYTGCGEHFPDKGNSYEELLQSFNDEYVDEDYEECFTAKASDEIWAEDHFLNNVNDFKYCSLEKVHCYTSSDKVTIPVDDNFKLSDLGIVLMGIYAEEPSLWNHLYQATQLEWQTFGVKYKDKSYEFEGGNDEGGSNEIVWFERNNNEWTDAEAIQERIYELEG